METRYLEVADINGFAIDLARASFPDYEPGVEARLFGVVLDAGRLESAAHQPRWDYYETPHDKAAALLRGMIKGHPFADGNKRIALATTSLYLFVNGHALVATNDELVDYAVALAASSPPPEVDEIAAWLREHTVAVETLADSLDGERLGELAAAALRALAALEGDE